MNKGKSFQVSKSVIKIVRVLRISLTCLSFFILLGSCETKEVQDTSELTVPHNNRSKADCDTQDKSVNGIKDREDDDIVDLTDQGNTGCSLESSLPQ